MERQNEPGEALCQMSKKCTPEPQFVLLFSDHTMCTICVSVQSTFTSSNVKYSG